MNHHHDRTKNYFSVRRYPALGMTTEEKDERRGEDSAWKAARIMSRPPRGSLCATHFFFGLDPSDAWTRAVKAAHGNPQAVLVWKLPIKEGPWSLCRVISDAPKFDENEESREAAE